MTAAARPARPHRPRLSVGFVLARRFTLCALASFVDVLRLSADEGDRSRQILCGWKVLSPTSRPIASSSGISIEPDERLGDPRRFDYVVVVGGLIDEVETLPPETARFLRAAAEAGVPLVGLCTGAFILSAIGLMNGYRCCVSWFHREDYRENFGGMEPVSDQIFVIDRDRITCSGGLSSAHVAAYLVERHVGPTRARKSLRIMIVDEAEAAEKPQPGIALSFDTDDPLVKRALLAMQEHIEAPLPIAALARLLPCGARQLERRFKRVLGSSPSEVYKRVRLEHAGFLLRTTRQSITEIAAATGFCDTSHLIRTFRERYGMTPARLRSAPAAPEAAELSPLGQGTRRA